MDRDTAEVVGQAQHLYYMTQTEGWRIAKQRLVELAVDITTTRNLDKSKSDSMIVKEMRANEKARDIILAFLAEVEGAIEHGKYLREVLDKHEKEEIIKITGDE